MQRAMRLKWRPSRLPEGFLGLAVTEYWERFALAGIKSLLTLVLIDHILAGDRSGVLGAAAAQAALEPLVGALSTAGLASQIYGLANALLYLSVPIGGLIGDRLSGRRGAVYIGGLAMIAGLALMLGRPTFLPGLALFAMGAGTLKGNLSAVVGALFADEGERRRGFALYLGFLNAGVMCGPLICGALAVLVGWQWGVAAAAAAIATGLVGYHRAVRSHPRREFEVPDKPSAGANGKGDIPLLAAVLLAVYLCFGAYEQVGNMFLVWARAEADLGRLPVPWLFALDGLFTLALIPLAQIGLRALAQRGIAVGALAQIALGCCACAIGNLILAMAEWGGEGPVPLAAPIGYLLFLDLAIVLVWPAGISLVTANAPARQIGLWVGFFYLHGLFANLWVGFGGAWYERMAHANFWLLHAAIAGAGAGIALLAGLARRRARWRDYGAITTSA
ncbi:MFS transporter [Sphingomonas gei]|uniref:MFS transporter n=1 Tax=Sphingomonas gei TaxID=1395960 RepID=A0A4S1X7W8_9SPHN|nr:MFS transporter [Sphingomonas gei]TGX52264.1 MFS transporter [Sphingomonas gei]